MDDLGNRSLLSDHTAIRIAIQKLAFSTQERVAVQDWRIKHTVFGSILSQLHDDHVYPSEAFSALADFNVLVCQAKARARSDLLRASPTTHGAKLLVAATAVRAYRNRHLSTLIRCCEVWELVGQCLDRITFECTTFHARSHIIASLTRGNITERADPIFFCHCHTLKKTSPWPKAGEVSVVGLQQNHSRRFMR